MITLTFGKLRKRLSLRSDGLYLRGERLPWEQIEKWRTLGGRIHYTKAAEPGRVVAAYKRREEK